MIKRGGNVQKVDVRPMDFIREAVKLRLGRLTIRERWAKLNWWTGSVEARETTMTYEVPDDVRR
jgi:hypothetical protein